MLYADADCIDHHNNINDVVLYDASKRDVRTKATTSINIFFPGTLYDKHCEIYKGGLNEPGLWLHPFERFLCHQAPF